MKWIRAGKGIRYFEHETRRFGNHLDRYYALSYKFKGKVHNEALGWESENRIPGKSMLQRAEEAIAQIRQNRRSGAGPVTKTERLEVEAIKKAEARRNHAREQLKNITLEEFFEQHFKPYGLRKLKEESYKSELSHYTIWIKDILGNTPIRDINLTSWDKLIAKISEKNLSDRTRRYICGTLCRILKLAKDRGYEVIIPTMKKLGLPQRENRRERIITQEELNDIFSGLQELNINAYRIAFFAFHTGCRFGEAASLKWSEVHDDSIVFRETKNRTTRTIPIFAPVKEILAGIQPRNSDFVFTSDTGEPYREPPASFRLIVDRLGLNVGCDPYHKITFHSL